MAEAGSKESEKEKDCENQLDMVEPGVCESRELCRPEQKVPDYDQAAMSGRGSPGDVVKPAASGGTHGAHDAEHASHDDKTPTTIPITTSMKPRPVKMPGAGDPTVPTSSPRQETTTPSKRRRVQHNYRRLSSSGFADEATNGNGNSNNKKAGDRFSSASESELSLSPATPPKVKPAKFTIPKKPERLLNGQSGRLFENAIQQTSTLNSI